MLDLVLKISVCFLCFFRKQQGHKTQRKLHHKSTINCPSAMSDRDVQFSRTPQKKQGTIPYKTLIRKNMVVGVLKQK